MVVETRQRARRESSRENRTSLTLDKDEHKPDTSTKSSNVTWRDDKFNIFILMLLYFMQGIPIGLSGAIPLLLQNHKIGYKEQAMFSFAFWPFSIKILWAPIVDGISIAALGRRKSWITASQLLIGISMIGISFHVKDMLDDPSLIFFMTCLFTFLNFLAATQDIGVDAWALCLLKHENIGWASTCNSVGQSAGFLVANGLFLILESSDFANMVFPDSEMTTGFVTLGGFMSFWGVIFIVFSILVQLIIHEEESVVEDDFGIMKCYKLLLQLLRKKEIQLVVLFALTSRVAFAACDGISSLKLIEHGVSKAHLSMLAIPLSPSQIILPLIISKYTSGEKAIHSYLRCIPFRLVFNLIYPLIVWWTGTFGAKDHGNFPWYYWGAVAIVFTLHQIFVYGMFVSCMAFFSRISDPKIGGTYMTLLNTFTNLGGNWPITTALYFVDDLTLKTCASNSELTCNTNSDCPNDFCQTQYDGYYIQNILGIIIGIGWLLYFTPMMHRLQNLPPAAWKIRH